jgi:hypothetical protein
MFINDRIITKKVDLKDLKTVQPKKARSLDEILAEIDAKNKATKTAGSNASVKTASTQVQAPAAPAAEAPKVATASTNAKTVNVEVKVAGMPDFIKEKIEEKKGDGDKKDEGKEEKKDDKPAFMEKKEEEKACSMAASAPKTMKVAKKLDFRGWKAEEVVAAWGQHGSMDKCIANVTAAKNDKGDAACTDPKLYCGLLQVASTEAGKMVKAASTEAPKTEQPKPSVFKKIAKLSDKEKSFLSKYYSKLYGSEYVAALLENY